MIAVVSSPSGTAGKAAIEEVQIAGKTGTAQWGPKARQRDAAWFVGFVPADKPKYAFAAVYEGEIGESTHGGTYAAPMIAKIMKQLFKGECEGEEGGAYASQVEHSGAGGNKRLTKRAGGEAELRTIPHEYGCRSAYLSLRDHPHSGINFGLISPFRRENL